MISFKSVVRPNLQDLESPGKYYARAVYSGETTLDELAFYASKQSTVSKADCYAVIISLLEMVAHHLSQGKIVRLGDLGSFRISLNSEGFDDAESVSSNAIKKAKILFSPGADLKTMLNNLSYSKISE